MKNSKIKRSSHFTMRALPACIALMASSMLHAQDSNEPKLDEVMVTAQKRAQRLQDVPIAISAISGLSTGTKWSWWGIVCFSALLMSINALCSILKR